MQNAKVVYLTQADKIPAEVVERDLMVDSGLDPEWTVLASTAMGWPRIHEALLELVKRGASSVDLVAAGWDGERTLTPVGMTCHVWGVI
ncbi:MAG: hypothetical protein C0609_09560 [Deltaproteobacteria bacterium]|nr:MAG: hypothetical protein C0609_09560 [Deltaproteobacteria bacterium]